MQHVLAEFTPVIQIPESPNPAARHSSSVSHHMVQMCTSLPYPPGQQLRPSGHCSSHSQICPAATGSSGQPRQPAVSPAAVGNAAVARPITSKQACAQRAAVLTADMGYLGLGKQR